MNETNKHKNSTEWALILLYEKLQARVVAKAISLEELYDEEFANAVRENLTGEALEEIEFREKNPYAFYLYQARRDFWELADELSDEMLKLGLDV